MSKLVSFGSQSNGGTNIPDTQILYETIVFYCSAFETDIETGQDVAYLDLPFNFKVTDVYATMKVAPTGSVAEFDILQNDTSILSTLITIDINETTSKTAATPPVISTDTLAINDRISIDITQVGSSTPGQEVVVYVIGYRII